VIVQCNHEFSIHERGRDAHATAGGTPALRSQAHRYSGLDGGATFTCEICHEAAVLVRVKMEWCSLPFVILYLLNRP
jgi:hypothetical protein